MNNPEVLFFDEPSVSLDASSVRTMWSLVQTLTKEHQSIMLLTTHDMNEIEEYSERVGILIRGELICVDSCFSLKKRFGRGYSLVIKYKSSSYLPHIREKVENFLPIFE